MKLLLLALGCSLAYGVNCPTLNYTSTAMIRVHINPHTHDDVS